MRRVSARDEVDVAFRGGMPAAVRVCTQERRASDLVAPQPCRAISPSRFDDLETAHVGTQDLGNDDRTVSLLVVLQNRYQAAADGQT